MSSSSVNKAPVGILATCMITTDGRDGSIAAQAQKVVATHSASGVSNISGAAPAPAAAAAAAAVKYDFASLVDGADETPQSAPLFDAPDDPMAKLKARADRAKAVMTPAVFDEPVLVAVPSEFHSPSKPERTNSVSQMTQSAPAPEQAAAKPKVYTRADFERDRRVLSPVDFDLSGAEFHEDLQIDGKGEKISVLDDGSDPIADFDEEIEKDVAARSDLQAHLDNFHRANPDYQKKMEAMEIARSQAENHTDLSATAPTPLDMTQWAERQSILKTFNDARLQREADALEIAGNQPEKEGWSRRKKAAVIVTVLALIVLGLILPGVLGGVQHGVNVKHALVDGFEKMGHFFQPAVHGVKDFFTGGVHISHIGNV
jgi:hypothetical protein